MRLLILLLAFFATSVAASARGDDPRTLQAKVATRSLDIDGVLNEADWLGAGVASEFVQYEPVEGARPSQATEVRVLYGDDAVYIGAYLFDTEPDRIMRTLGRRDDFNQADWFFVSLDSYLDRKTAYTFGVNAAGIQRDGITTRELDSSWDAVWQSAVRLTADGWVVEMRIPLSMIRYSEGGETWGINFWRIIPRTSETLEWAMVPRTQRRSAYVSSYGQLQGLLTLTQRRNVQVLPYSVSRLDTFEDDDGLFNRNTHVEVGADLKVGLTSNITLDATINPDFGQVDADPAELNLTAFESFFREKRPFFVEGAQILDFRLDFDGSLLYTRRIGASEPIIGATKISGRTDRGLSFGVLGAATGDNFDPGRQYGVLRARQEVGSDSYIGAIVTGFGSQQSDETATDVSAGADWDLRLGGNTYQVDGFAAMTSDLANGGGGFAFSGGIDRIRGTWTWSNGFRAFSDGFDPNGTGRLRRGDFMRWTSTAGYEINGGEAFGPFRRGSARAFGWQSWSYRERINQGAGLNLFTNLTTRSFQDVQVRAEVENLFGNGYDVYETRGLGPWAMPRELNIRGEFRTDSRRSWRIEPSAHIDRGSDGRRGVGAGLEANWNAGTKLALEAGLSVSHMDNRLSWASNETFRAEDGTWAIGVDSGDLTGASSTDFAGFAAGTDLSTAFGSEGDHHAAVMGRRDTRSVDLSLRSNVTFSKALSLQFYGQFFVARGRFRDFSLLKDRDSLVPLPSYPKQHDFSLASFQTNLVLRWEYRPGSALFLVWSQARRDRIELDPLDLNSNSPFESSPFDQASDALGLFPRNAFLIKLNYLFLR